MLSESALHNLKRFQPTPEATFPLVVAAGFKHYAWVTTSEVLNPNPKPSNPITLNPKSLNPTLHPKTLNPKP